jgi:hypothetical protein
MLSLCRGRMSVAYVRMDKPERLCLLKGDMPLSAVWAPRLRTVFYASEEWMLDEALEGFAPMAVELDPMTLSFLDAEDLRDVAREEIFFKAPEAITCQAAVPKRQTP